ncbi:MAG: hypothetical protein ACJAXW_002552 [Candidatus Azotimanducaceae bacterium]|jgi:hypothetical protein
MRAPNLLVFAAEFGGHRFYVAWPSRLIKNFVNIDGGTTHNEQ